MSDTAADPGATRRLAEFLAGLDYDSLPPAVVAGTKTFILDFVGAALGAVHTPEAHAAVNVVRALGGHAESSLIGFPDLTSCQHAAFANSLVGHVLELDDTHRDAICHVGAPVIPAALAMAERAGADGRTLIVAVVAGYEACLRVANAVQPSHWRMGFLSMGTCGTFGAAAAAAHCLRLDAETLANAFGLAAMQAAGINSSIYNGGDMAKRLVPSHAAQAGVMAALLAREGLTGTTNVIEGKFGFCEVFATDVDLARVTADLGRTYEILRTSLKPYSCCRYYHAPIDGLLHIMGREKLAADAIDRVLVRTYDIAVTNRPHRARPATVFDAKMSMPFSLAVAATAGRVDEADLTEASLKDGRLQAFADKVTIEADAAMSRAFPVEWPAWVRVTATDGRVFEHRVPYPKGEPEAPMTEAEVRDKFLGLACAALPRRRAEEVIEAIGALERAKGLGELFRLLRVPDSRRAA